MAIATILFYDYFLTLQDEVCVFFRLRLPVLTSSRYGMGGGGKNRGVRCPGFDGSGYCIELRKVFAIFIMVRTMALPHTQSASGLIPCTEQISTDGVYDLACRGYVP